MLSKSLQTMGQDARGTNRVEQATYVSWGTEFLRNIAQSRKNNHPLAGGGIAPARRGARRSPLPRTMTDVELRPDRVATAMGP